MSSRTEIISLAHKKTENCLQGQIDDMALFYEVLQNFCAEDHFWWRKKRFTFSTVGGTDSYDLSNTSTVVTSPVNAGPFVEEVVYVGRVDGPDIMDVDPIFDDAAIAQWELDTTQDKPGVYTVESNNLTNSQTLRLHKTPNGIYKINVAAWMMPLPIQDNPDDVVYIVPPTHHHILQTGMEKEIWRLKYGQQDPKFETAEKLYDMKVATAKVSQGFSTSKTVNFHRRDGKAIRSTR